MSAKDPGVKSGCYIAYRAFDAADAVSLRDAEQLLLDTGIERASVEFRRRPRRELGALREAAVPLWVDLGPRQLVRGESTIPCSASARLFDYGTISVAFEFPLRDATPLAEVAQMAADLESSPQLSEMAQEEYTSLTETLGAALHGKHPPGEEQRYAVVIVEGLDESTSKADLLAWPELPKLVACERDDRPVSEEQRADALRSADSYRSDDLVVIGTGCALVLEPSGARDVPEVLEVVRAQMAQLSHYDVQLDLELKSAYQDLDRGGAALAFWSPFGTQVKRLSRRRLELSAFTERVDSALEVVADAFLGRVYVKATERFAVPAIRNRVAHKHRLLLDLYTALKDEVAMLRSLTLEVLIVLLILFEVVFALV